MTKYFRPTAQENVPVNDQMCSPSFRIASLDDDYLLSDSMRGVRFMLEYSKTEEILEKKGIRSTVVVFGSARVREDGKGKQPHWYNSAREVGRLVSLHGGALSKNDGTFRDNVIATGGGPGIMEAANRGAQDVQAPTIGYNITLPHEQQPNSYSTPELTFNFHYFAMRKMHFTMRANALVVFPGGFGTLDELFELLTLCQTGRARRFPIILFDQEYWSSAINFQVLVDHGMVNPNDLELFDYAETAGEVLEKLTTGDLSILRPEATSHRDHLLQKHRDYKDEMR